ncbi:MAG: hypothetical protein B7733_01385 [Myxococcales bacterium FL481]|nr:MAG: hypothetical protein B7733_01385 [Myxococcales bacterium FL481]
MRYLAGIGFLTALIGLVAPVAAMTQEDIDYDRTTREFCDSNDSGEVCGELTMGDTQSSLRITSMTSGVTYNWRLSTRCEDGRIFRLGGINESAAIERSYRCGPNVKPLRIAAEIDVQ